MIANWEDDVPLLEEVFTTETSYDALNRPVTIIHPDNSEISYVYDKGGLLQKVLKDQVEHITNIIYNPKGQRENIAYGNNTRTRYLYNPLNFRLTRILTSRNTAPNLLQDLNYEYDATGNIIQQTDNAQTIQYFGNQQVTPVSTYEYDALYRLTKATGRELANLAAPTHNDFPNNIPCPAIVPANLIRRYMHYYQYDAMGNMLQMQNAGNWTRNYIYDTLTNRLLKHDLLQSSNDYTYDEHGNITSMPHLSLMSWDEKDQLISASNGTFTSYYNYDNQGNRTRKVVDKGNIIETRYYIGGYEVYRKEVNQTLTLERKTLNISDDEKVFVRIEQKTGENEIMRYQYDNHLGSACLELDEQGYIISYEEYHPFGTTSYCAMNSSIEVSMKRYRFCGKERDEETGLYYFGARFYAPWICRFCCCDIMQFKYSELTPYNYCANNPVKFIDLDGMEVKLKTHYKKDASGNDTKQVERYELNITGKVINMSGKDIDMDKAAKEIISQIESSFKGETDKGIPITTNANFTVAESMKDVTPSDHLIVFANMTDGGTGKTPNGVACDYGGKVAFVGASFFNFRKDRIAAHEMGHLLGLKHTSSGLMRSDYLGSKVSSSELGSIIRNCKASTAFPLLNKGPNRSGKMPYTGQVGQYVNMKLYKK